jgi:hypothetical protein
MIYNKIYIRFIAFFCVAISSLTSCTTKTSSHGESEEPKLSELQQKLIDDGWCIPKTLPNGELSNEYGIKNKYGQQDNYFDIQIGHGCDVAIKIVDAATDQCIRYVFVPEDTTVNIQMIPQGKYYLKLAYGKGWMEYSNDDGSISAKFTQNVSYDKSIDLFDFGKKNSASEVSYVLQINVENSVLHNFTTTPISEDEFMY